VLTGLHLCRQWRGQPDHFGISVAILCGDLCMSYSDEMLHHCGLPANRVRAAQQLTYQRNPRLTENGAVAPRRLCWS
jgi:geranylgeranyl diphosphate synthase, type I